MGIVNDIVKDIPLPKMIRVRQTFPRPFIEDVPAEIHNQLSRPEIQANIRPGMSIALTAGSRGIVNIALIIREVAKICTELGAKPFVVPAMGSHGGATAEGQLEVLHTYGITEDYIGCPIRATMEVTHIGNLEDTGDPVYIDKYAAAADGIIVIGRIKPHTAFRADYESGIVKMMAIGLAKQRGAEECHEAGLSHLATNVYRYGTAIMKNAKILFGFAIVDNAYDETAKLASLTPEEILSEEPKLLSIAKENRPRIMFPSIDVLIVDEIGKNISGDGMDPNIVGSFGVPGLEADFHAQRIAVLDLTEETHGNATGLGLADICSRQAYEKYDFEMTYPNALTSKGAKGVFIPIVMDNHRLAVQAAIKMVDGSEYDKMTLVRIKNTLELDEIYISESLLPQAKNNPGIKILSEPVEMAFNKDGNFAD